MKSSELENSVMVRLLKFWQILNCLNHLFLLVFVSISFIFQRIFQLPHWCLIYLYEIFYNILLLSFYCLYTSEFYFVFGLDEFYFFYGSILLGSKQNLICFYQLFSFVFNKRWLHPLFLAFVVSKMEKETEICSISHM